MADMKWNSVGVDFKDTNSGFQNAMSTYSNVGTIFGNLRKSILDEEQRAVDNAFKEKEFNEKIRQFDERLGFDKSVHADNEKQRAWDNQFKLDEFDWKKLDAKERNDISRISANASARSAAAAEKANSLREQQRAFDLQEKQLVSRLESIASSAPNMPLDQYEQTVEALMQSNDPREQSLGRQMKGEMGTIVVGEDGKRSAKGGYQLYNAMDKGRMVNRLHASYNPEFNAKVMADEQALIEFNKGQNQNQRNAVVASNKAFSDAAKDLNPDQISAIRSNATALSAVISQALGREINVQPEGFLQQFQEAGIKTASNYFAGGKWSFGRDNSFGSSVGFAADLRLSNRDMAENMTNTFLDAIQSGKAIPGLNDRDRAKAVEATRQYINELRNTTPQQQAAKELAAARATNSPSIDDLDLQGGSPLTGPFRKSGITLPNGTFVELPYYDVYNLRVVQDRIKDARAKLAEAEKVIADKKASDKKRLKAERDREQANAILEQVKASQQAQLDAITQRLNSLQ